MKKRGNIYLLLALLTASFFTAHTQAASFSALGGPDMTGYVESTAAALSADGLTVVGDSMVPEILISASRWTKQTGWITIFAGSWSNAMAVSADGSVLMGIYDGGTFLWSSNSGVEYIDSYWASALSDNGLVVAGQDDGQAFRWTRQNGIEYIGEGHATALSFDGSVVVGDDNGRLFRWTSSQGMVFLLGSAAHKYYPAAVTPDGSVIVGHLKRLEGHYDLIRHRYVCFWKQYAFRWTEQTGQVDLLGEGSAYDVTDDGAIVVGSFGIWNKADGIRKIESILTTRYGLDVSGWQFSDGVKAISADGKVLVGKGINPNGFHESWIVDTNRKKWSGNYCRADNL